MIRIMTTDDPGATRITIDGELVGPYIDAVKNSVDEAIGRKKVHLFLRDVAQIDEDGRKLLLRLAGKGVELSGSGVYTSHVVGEVQRELARRIPETRPTMPSISI